MLDRKRGGIAGYLADDAEFHALDDPLLSHHEAKRLAAVAIELHHLVRLRPVDAAVANVHDVAAPHPDGGAVARRGGHVPDAVLGLPEERRLLLLVLLVLLLLGFVASSKRSSAKDKKYKEGCSA